MEEYYNIDVCNNPPTLKKTPHLTLLVEAVLQCFNINKY